MIGVIRSKIQLLFVTRSEMHDRKVTHLFQYFLFISTTWSGFLIIFVSLLLSENPLNDPNSTQVKDSEWNYNISFVIAKNVDFFNNYAEISSNSLHL